MEKKEFKFSIGQRVWVEKIHDYANVLDRSTLNGGKLYLLDNYEKGFGRIFSEDTLRLNRKTTTHAKD